MGTSVSANLFSSAPAVAANGVNSVKTVSVDSRSSATAQQGGKFSDQLKNASVEDKIATAIESETKATAPADAITAKAEPVEGQSDVAEEKVPVAEKEVSSDVEENPEAGDVPDLAENLAAAQVAVNVAPMPMVELATYFQPVSQENQPESVAAPMPEPELVEMELPKDLVKDTMAEAPVQQATTPETGVAAQNLQQPTMAASQAQQEQTSRTQVETKAKDVAVVNDTVVDEAEVQPMPQTAEKAQADMPQPKSIEALLKPVQPVEPVQPTKEAAEMTEQPAMSKEQQMLAVLSGGRFVNRTPQGGSSQPVQPQAQPVQPQAQPVVQEQQAQPVQQMPQMQANTEVAVTVEPVQQEPEVIPQVQAQVVDPATVKATESEMPKLAASEAPRMAPRAAESPVSTSNTNTTVDEMNNILGQEVRVVAGTAEQQGPSPDGRQAQEQPQSFRQEPTVEAAAVFNTSQQAEAEEPVSFSAGNEPVQAANAFSGQQVVNDTVQVDNQQPVSQTRTDYNITQQIVEQARLIRSAENTEMVIKLNPRHLGDLTLRVAVNSNGGVTATFHTDNAQVRALLETSMIQLRQELNDQGIKVDSVEVQTGLTDGQLPEGQGQGYYQQQAQQSARSQKLDLKDFEEDVDQLSAEPVNQATEVIRDSEGNKISDGVDYAV